MHDGGGKRDQDLEALPQILDKLIANGFKIVSIQELMKSDSSIPSDIADGSATMPDDCVWPTELAQVVQTVCVDCGTGGLYHEINNAHADSLETPWVYFSRFFCLLPCTCLHAPLYVVY